MSSKALHDEQTVRSVDDIASARYWKRIVQLCEHFITANLILDTCFKRPDGSEPTPDEVLACQDEFCGSVEGCKGRYGRCLLPVKSPENLLVVTQAAQHMLERIAEAQEKLDGRPGIRLMATDVRPLMRELWALVRLLTRGQWSGGEIPTMPDRYLSAHEAISEIDKVANWCHRATGGKPCVDGEATADASSRALIAEMSAEIVRKENEASGGAGNGKETDGIAIENLMRAMEFTAPDSIQVFKIAQDQKNDYKQRYEALVEFDKRFAGYTSEDMAKLIGCTSGRIRQIRKELKREGSNGYKINAEVKD